VLGTLNLLVFSNFSPETTKLASISAERISAFKNVILFTSAFTLFSAALVWWFVPNNKEYRPADTIRLSQICRLLKIPSVWLLALIIICAYVGYKITDDFSLYANEVLGGIINTS
jgi:MFS transporter, GlpU family, inner membrane protein